MVGPSFPACVLGRSKIPKTSVTSPEDRPATAVGQQKTNCKENVEDQYKVVLIWYGAIS
jgi:hypothetical protein